MINFTRLSLNSDKLGVFSSTLCLIHCLALPAIVSAEPMLAGVLPYNLEFLEFIFLFVSVIAVYFSTRNTATWLKYLFFGVLGIFTIAILLEDTLSWIHYLSYLGSAGLISAHVYNFYRAPKCEVAPSKTLKRRSKKLVYNKVYTPAEQQS